MTATHPTRRADRVVGVEQGARSGATLIAVGGVHGNEPAGIVAARRVLDLVEPSAMRGRLVALAGNLAALADPDPDVRYLDRDLNRMFTEPLIRGARDTPPDDRDAEQRESLELLEAIDREIATCEGPAYVLDMHTVSSPSPAFVFVEDALPARHFASRFPLPLVFGFEEELHGLLVDFATTRLGVISLLLEAGLHDDPASARVHEAAIWIAMEAAGMIDDAGAERHELVAGAAGGRSDLVYDVRHREPIRTDAFVVERTLHSFDEVRRGQTRIAIDGDLEIAAPMTGLLFMPNRQRDRRVGDDGFFIVRRIGRVWLALSSTLRRLEVMHRLLPLVAPGVRRCPRRPGTLLVSPRIAPVLKREVFHLLGYRLLRHAEDVHLTWWQRIARGAGAVVHSMREMLTGAFRGGERAALSRESPDDWIVARRTLDLKPPRGVGR